MKYSNTLVLSAAALALGMSASISNAQLNHRYSFSSDATDSVGSADGTLMGTASIAVGQVTLDGLSDSIVSLDAATIAINTYSSVTIESWATAYAPSSTGFHTLLGLGQVNTGNSDLAANYVILQPFRGDNVSRISISLSDDGDPWNDETGANGPELNDGAEHYYAAVITPTSISLYVDGALTETVANSQSLSGVSTEFALIGAAYPGDPNYVGQVNELRIYGNALPAFAIEANYAAGPDAVALVPEPTTFALLGFGMLGMLMARRRS